MKQDGVIVMYRAISYSDCLLQVHLLLKAAPREENKIQWGHRIFILPVTSLNNTKHLQTLEESCCSCESICFSLGFVFRPDASGMFESCILACLVMSTLAVKGACGKKPTVLSVIRLLAFFAEPIHVPNAFSPVCVQLPIIGNSPLCLAISHIRKMVSFMGVQTLALPGLH